MESIGHASIHKAQPMQNCSSINAVDSRSVAVISLSSGMIEVFINSARSRMTSLPPGAHRFIFALDFDMASAYV